MFTSPRSTSSRRVLNAVAGALERRDATTVASRLAVESLPTPVLLVDAVITRALAFVPLYVLGFAEPAVYAYLVFVSFHAIFVHTNMRFTFGRLAWLVGTPRFHHWHHSAQPEAVDKNFAIHLPVIDRIFGTLYLPDRAWPAAYGIADSLVPERYPAQLVFPFTDLPVTGLR